MGAETSVVVALFFLGFLIVSAFTYSWVDPDQNLVTNAQNVHDTTKNAWLQTDIKITNVSFLNSSGNVYLNISLKNTGKTTLNTGLLEFFVNGNYIDSSYCLNAAIKTWVPKNITNISIYSVVGNITLDNATSTAIGSASSITWSHTVWSLSHSLLVVGVDIDKTNGSVTSITYAGVPLTRAAYSVVNTGDTVRAELWYLANPKAGTNNIVVNLSTTEGAAAGAVSFSGVDGTTPIPTTATGFGSNGNASTSITTANAYAWIIDTVVRDNTAAKNATSPQVERWNIASGIGGGGSTKNTTTPGSQTMGWSGTSGWAQVAAEIKPFMCSTPTKGRIKVVTENGIWDYAIAS
ncbi:MAG: hypothetical protein ABOK23_08310 [Candidatus Methanoperedens sp.]|nr:hypothetical protein [Candidatus Methanoperedens sp.]